MTPTKYPQWTPDHTSNQVGDPRDDLESLDDRDILRNPGAFGQPETVTRVGNRPPQPRPVELDRAIVDPSAAPVVDRVDATAHLKDRRPSTDRYGDLEQGGPSGYVDEPDDVDGDR
jgi:hypothetical protein